MSRFLFHTFESQRNLTTSAHRKIQRYSFIRKCSLYFCKKVYLLYKTSHFESCSVKYGENSKIGKKIGLISNRVQFKQQLLTTISIVSYGRQIRNLAEIENLQPHVTLEILFVD